MNSYALFNFAVTRDFEVDGKPQQRVYQLSIQPGAPWSEIYTVLDELKSEFQVLEEQAKTAEKEKKDSEPAIDPEIVA